MNPTPQPNIRRALLWFGIYNLVAIGLMIGLYLFVYYGTFMNPLFDRVYRYFDRHQTQAVLAAAMPFFASLLVGFGYARRAAKRRAREQEKAQQ